MFHKLNVAIMGTGNIACTMAETLGKMRNVKCYAVASRTKEKAEVFAGEYGFKKAYGSYEELVQDKNVELVYIATPHSEHYQNAMLCLENEKPVLCEKAFTANAAQAKELFAYAAEKKVLIAEAIWTRYMPMLRTIKEVLASGCIGKPVMLTANLGYPISKVPRLTDPELAGGALLDVGVYPLNFAAMIFGTEIEKVQSACTYTESGVDEQESITLIYKDKKTAVLHATMLAPTDRQGIIYGTEGYMIVENINNFESITVYNQNHEKENVYKRPKQISGYEYEVEACAKALKEGWIQCPEMPHEESLKMMQLMDSIREQWGIVYPFEKAGEGSEKQTLADAAETADRAEEMAQTDGTESVKAEDAENVQNESKECVQAAE